MGILPNQFHGVLGDHGENMPIENLKLSHDKKYLVSSGHDDKLQFWDVAHLFQEDPGEEDEEDNDTIDNGQQVKPTVSSFKKTDVKDDGNDDDDDSWGTDSDEEITKQKKRKKTQKKEAMKPKKKNTKTAAFFADM